jgi:hypothetical protein
MRKSGGKNEPRSSTLVCGVRSFFKNKAKSGLQQNITNLAKTGAIFISL